MHAKSKKNLVAINLILEHANLFQGFPQIMPSVFLRKIAFNRYYTAIPYRASTGPVQGQNRVFPVKFFSQGKTTQGKPCTGPVLALYWPCTGLVWDCSVVFSCSKLDLKEVQFSNKGCLNSKKIRCQKD